MMINDYDVAEFGGRQWNVTPGFTSAKNNSEWVAGAPTPYLTDSWLQMATLKVAILVKGRGRDEILLRCSDLIAQLTAPVSILLDGFTRQFMGTVSKWSLTESSRRRFHLLTIEASGYWEDIEEYKKTLQLTSGTAARVNNPGNARTPVRIELTAAAAAQLLSVTGAGATITVSDVDAGDVIVLDGVTGLFTINASVDARITAWELPTLAPGDCEVTVSGADAAAVITYRPRYM